MTLMIRVTRIVEISPLWTKIKSLDKIWKVWAGALVQWLWEETHIPKVVGSNPSAGYWMDMTFFTLICCKNCIVCLKRPKINKKEAGIGSFKKIWKVYLVFGQTMNLLWQQFLCYWPISIVVNGQILQNRLDIWSHWCRSQLTVKSSNPYTSSKGSFTLAFLLGVFVLRFSHSFYIFCHRCILQPRQAKE